MKKMLFFFLASILLLPSPLLANVFEPYTVKKIRGALYFTPAVSSKEFALFGYMNKITPTPEEIEAEKKRINAVIDQSIKQGYGSWENFEKAMREAGKQSAQGIKKEAPQWVKSLLPPSLIKETIPLLMKGALIYVRAHPESMREPIGNVGETGIIIVNKWGNVTKIPLGINTPVVSMDISSDGKMAAVLTDMSFEDEKGRLHPLGEISLIDLYSKKRIQSFIFANLAEHVAFVPGTHMLAFECYADRKDLGKREIRFIDLKHYQVTKHHYPAIVSGSGSIFGKNACYPGFILAPIKSFSTPIIALYNKSKYEFYEVFTNRKLFEIPTRGRLFVFAHKHPWVFSGKGELWDYENKKLIAAINPRLNGMLLPLFDAEFTKDDRNIIYLEGNFLTRFDTEFKKAVVNTHDFNSRGGIFFLTPDNRFIISFVSEKGMATYKKRYLKRRKLCLRVIATEDLRVRQNICFKDSTVIDAAMAGNTLIVSDYDKLHIYVNTASMSSQEGQSPETTPSLLAEIEENPEKFANKIIELDGWAWGWMAPPPEVLKDRSIHFAKGNYGSKMDGTFTDGIVSVLYPVPVGFSGPFHLMAKVIITPYGWQLVPVK
ncbi:MAG: hypothetical protein H5U39_00305 [Deferribacterales bacterium]|nr:hypothetical protein [Deferribacterales bacterium]